jgi:hypothetical protein
MAKPEIDSNEFGRVLKVRGRWDALLQKKLLEENIKQLELSYSNGWRGKDLNFLEQLPDLETLYIWDLSGLDVSGVQFLPGLKRLHVHIWKKPSQPLAFEKLASLESCEMDWNPALQSVLTCSWLKRLKISDMKGVPSLNLAMLSELNEFWLTRAYGLEKIRFPSQSNLVEIVLRRISALRGIDSWAYVKKLTRLWLTECKQLEISSISAAAAVKELDLSNMGPIPSLRFANDFRALETLRLSGSTEIRDGQLAFFTKLPKLKSLTFPPKGHYDLSPQKARELLEAR